MVGQIQLISPDLESRRCIAPSFRGGKRTLLLEIQKQVEWRRRAPQAQLHARAIRKWVRGARTQ